VKLRQGEVSQKNRETERLKESKAFADGEKVPLVHIEKHQTFHHKHGCPGGSNLSGG
jgi:hypothetical protein